MLKAVLDIIYVYVASVCDVVLLFPVCCHSFMALKGDVISACYNNSIIIVLLLYTSIFREVWWMCMCECTVLIDPCLSENILMLCVVLVDLLFTLFDQKLTQRQPNNQ